MQNKMHTLPYTPYHSHHRLRAKKNMHGHTWPCILAIILCLCACTGQTRYYTYQATPSQGWTTRDTLHFDLPAFSDTEHLQLSLALRLTYDYPYENLWIVVDQQQDSVYHTCDTLEITIPPHLRSLKSEGASFRQIEIPLFPLHLEADHATSIKVRHIMQPATITGIHDLGLKVDQPARP